MAQLRDGLTLYVRNPAKKYAFEKVGKVEVWRLAAKYIEINGKLYTLIE